MKKISVLAGILAGIMLLCSCTGTEDDEKTTPADGETTAVEAKSKEELEVDFATVRVADFAYAYAGGEKISLENGAKAEKSSKPSVATVDDKGNIVPHKKGVTLVAYEKEGKVEAVAVCVFAEGEKPDRSSGGSAELVEAGGTYMHTAPVGGVEYSTSDESVVSVLEAPKLSFVGVGYACVTCASISRPFAYSFIVYDRVVEK